MSILIAIIHMKIITTTPDKNEFIKRTVHIAKPPESIYYLGTLPKGSAKVAAIVGSRRPTAYGREVTQMIARELAQAGVIVISGMAIGIDAIAHTAALNAGGITVAVLPCGLDDVYPKSNIALARRIITEKGALISEYKPGTLARGYLFLERNRIVSALADVVIVTEAAIKSGTLSTVAHALDQGKTVFAVPGNITSPMSAGCNHLIRQGAVPLIHTQDVLQELGIDKGQQLSLILGDDISETTIISLLQVGIQDGDTLLLQSRMSTSTYNQTMTMLEIKGVIRPLGANHFVLS